MNKGRLVVGALGCALLGCFQQTAEAGAITFGPAVTITATTDVSTAGTLKYAHSWALGDRTNNGVKFVGTTLNNGTISNNVNLVGFGQQNSAAFNSATAPFGSLPASYRGILTGAVYGAANTTGSVTLLQLTPGRQYQVQLWVSDPRAGATTSRTQVATSVAGNSQTMKYNVAAAAGSPGQLVTGSFLVDGTSQLLRVVGVGGFVGGTNLPQINALQVRELAGGAYWNGLQNGILDEASTNYQGGLSLAQITASVANVYFADQDQLGTAVANTNLTVAVGGLRIPNLFFVNTNKRYTVVGSDTNGLSGSSAITLLGAGRAVLAGENTFTGNIIVDKGVLVLQHERALGTSTKTLDVTLTTDTGGVELEGGITVPTGIVWQTSNQGPTQPAIRSVSGTNVIAGPIQLTGGGGNTRAVVESGSMLTLAGPVTNIYIGARTLELGGAGAGVVAGTISDGNSTTVLTGVTKDGAGTWTLAGTNTFVGGTVVNAGTLALGADATLPSRNIALAGGAVLDVTAAGGFVLAGDQTLQGSGLITGAVSTVDGAKLIPGAPGTVGTLTFGGGLQLGAGATNLFDLGAGTNDVVAVVGDLEPANAVVRLAALVPPVSGSYPLFTYSGSKGTTFDPAVRHFLASRVALSLDETGTVGQVRLVVDAPAAQDLAWNPAVSATWDMGVSNWVDAATRTVTDRFYEADTVLFDDAGAASNVINLATLVRPARVTVDAAADYTFTGAGRIGNPVLAATSRLVKAGSGTLTVAVTNEFTGGTVISNGTVAVAAAGTLGTGAVTLDGGRLAGSGGSNTVANAVVVNSAASVIDDGGGLLTLTGLLGGPGGLVKTGAGQVNLHPASPNSYAGGTVVNEGTLRLGFANTTLNSGTLQGELTIQTGAVVQAAIEKAIGLAVAASGNVTVVRINEGLLDFTGINGLGGGQTVFMQSGEIRSNGGTNSPAAAGFYRFNASGTNPTLYTLSHAAPAVMSGRVQLDTTANFVSEDGPAAADLRIDASITGGNPLRKQGAGTLLLTGSNTFSGETGIQTGTLAIGASAFLASPVYRLTSGATLDVSAASGWTVNPGQALVGGGTVVGGVIARSGSVVRAGGLGLAETLTFANDLGLQAGSTFGFDLTDVPAVGGGTNDLVVVAGRLEPSNTVVVINPLKPLGTGTYTLVTHDGTKTTFFNPAVQGNGSRQSWTLDESTVPTVVALVVTGGFESLVWRPQANAAWDLASSNWFVTSGSTTDRFYQFDTVLFDDSGAYSNLVTLSGALNPQTITVNASSNYTLTGPGSIGGTNGLLKQGAGTLVLNSTNTYTGGTRVEGGVLSIANNGHLGSSAVSNSVTLDVGTLQLTASFTPPANRKLVVGPGGGTLTGTGTAGLTAVPEDALKGGGPLLIAGNSAGHTVLQTGSAQSNFSGAITIAGGRINLNNGLATLGSGEITVGGGSASLYLSSTVALANVINIQSDGGETRGAVRFQVGGTLNGPLVLQSNASIGVEGLTTGIVNGPITGAFAFTVGPLNAGNDASYHLFASNAQAATVIRKGILGLTNDYALGAPGAPLIMASGFYATLRALGDGIVVDGARTIALGGAGTSRFDTDVHTLTLAAPLLGTGPVAKAGSGTLVLSAASSYIGATAVSNGTLVIGADDALPAGTLLTLGSLTNRAHLVLTNHSQSVSGLLVRVDHVGTNFITIGAGQRLRTIGSISEGIDRGGTSTTETRVVVAGPGALVVTGGTAAVVVGLAQASQNRSTTTASRMDLSRARMPSTCLPGRHGHPAGR
jgi:fibronectin-binding autotransporter adhesin